VTRTEYDTNEIGSRNADGNVPNANWNDSKFKVDWNYHNNQNPNLRSREVSRNQGGVMLLFA
jgi:hypothetical protein